VLPPLRHDHDVDPQKDWSLLSAATKNVTTHSTAIGRSWRSTVLTGSHSSTCAPCQVGRYVDNGQRLRERASQMLTQRRADLLCTLPRPANTKGELDCLFFWAAAWRTHRHRVAVQASVGLRPRGIPGTSRTPGRIDLLY
jgi:hypothetical protein